MNEITKQDIEVFMMSQFIEVMNIISRYNNIEEVKADIENRKKVYMDYINKMNNSKEFISLNLYNKDIDSKIKKGSEIYSTSKEYRQILEELELKCRKLETKLNDKEKIEEIKALVYELCRFDVHLAYKIGLVDGMKIKK